MIIRHLLHGSPWLAIALLSACGGNFGSAPIDVTAVQTDAAKTEVAVTGAAAASAALVSRPAAAASAASAPAVAAAAAPDVAKQFPELENAAQAEGASDEDHTL